MTSTTFTDHKTKDYVPAVPAAWYHEVKEDANLGSTGYTILGLSVSMRKVEWYKLVFVLSVRVEITITIQQPASRRQTMVVDVQIIFRPSVITIGWLFAISILEV